MSPAAVLGPAGWGLRQSERCPAVGSVPETMRVEVSPGPSRGGNVSGCGALLEVEFVEHGRIDDEFGSASPQAIDDGLGSHAGHALPGGDGVGCGVGHGDDAGKSHEL